MNDKQQIQIALAGNPNCGKTTIFNALTGARQRVGNWPGVTVERVVGLYDHHGTAYSVTDLPGIYSFSACSVDEVVARRHILMDRPDLVVNILDASNLERNLYLTTQLLEMRVPVIVALNMLDRAEQRGIRIEIEHLARHLGCPVVPIVASRGKGIDELRETITRAAAEQHVSRTHVAYDSELEKAIETVRSKLSRIAQEHHVDDRWLSLKLLEQDELAFEIAQPDNTLHELITHEMQRVERHTGDDGDIVIADGRYGFIHGLALDVIRRDLRVRQSVSDVIDRVALNRWLGIPFFLAVMYLVFAITINIGEPFIAFFDQLCDTLFVSGAEHLLLQIGAPGWVIALLAHGLGAGIQTVATFIPPIFFLFLCLSFLEDSGYMARAAFVMDRLLRLIGLPGKAFIPLLVGFGCNVPGIMAARTLENRRDRILTILINPFMSCGARLPVYTLFAAIFFPRQGGMVIFGLYLTGILLAVGSALLFKRTLFRGEISTFVMELPPYHMPTFLGILYHTGVRLRSFLVRAGKVILVVVLILGFLYSLGMDGSFGNQDSADSVLSRVSRGLTPVFRPMGITDDNWPASVGLFTGIFAKELIVGTLDSLYSQEARSASDEEHNPVFDFKGGIADAFRAIPAGFSSMQLGLFSLPDDPAEAEDDVSSDARRIMRERFDGRVGAAAYLLFVLIYAPCLAVVATIIRETSWRWGLLSLSYLTGLAWILSTLFYQSARFLRHPASSLGWITVCLALLLGVYGLLKRLSRRIQVPAEDP